MNELIPYRFDFSLGARRPPVKVAVAISDGLLPDDALSPAAHANLVVCSESRYGQALKSESARPVVATRPPRRVGGWSRSAGSLPVPLRPQAEGMYQRRRPDVTVSASVTRDAGPGSE